MITRSAKKAGLAALAAGFLLCPAARAQTAAERLAAYETFISSGDPAAAAAFLADGEVLTLVERDASRAAALQSEAEALKDLQDLLAMPWPDARANSLSQALSIRLDVDKPLSKVGVGPEPEKLLPWLEKYQPAYPASKTATVKKAIRQWEIVFGTMTVSRLMSWGEATVFSGEGVTLARADWTGWTIRERNAVIAKLMTRDPAFTIYSDETLSGDVRAMDLQTTVDAVRNSGVLSPAQLAGLTGKSLADKIYLLGSYFDGSNIAVSDDIRMKIHAARDSMPKEILSASQRDLLGSMLNTAVPRELAGTMAGDRVLEFYAANGPLKIAVRPCDSAYSRYDAATGTIVLDSETIQRYMHMKGYTAGSLMRTPEQLAEIAKYMSPMVVYESAHQMQDVWAGKSGVYKPHVQEDEIEAMSLEGLYTGEKIDKDAAFKRIMSGARDYSSYASKRVEVATEYRTSGSKKFATTVRQRYFSGLPSLDAAASQVLGAVSDELARRGGLTAAEKAELDSSGLTLAEVMAMGPEELAGSVGEIRSDALLKIRTDLSALGVYRAQYSGTERSTRKDLKTLKAGSAGRTPAPPAL